MPRSKNLREWKFPIGTDAYGKTIRKSFYGKTKKQAAKKWQEHMDDLKNEGNKPEEAKAVDSNLEGAKTVETVIPEVAEAPSLLFEDWALKWLETYVVGVKGNTFKYTYRSTIVNHLIPYFCGDPLDSITPLNIQNFFNTKTNMSYSLIDKCDFILKGILDRAVDNDLINKSPFRGIKIPPGVEGEEKQAYTQEQARIHLDFCRTHEYGLIGMLPLKTSCSRSEVAALQFTDFNHEEQVLYVHRGMDSLKEVGSGKTKNRKRFVPYDDELEEMLAQHRSKGIYLFCHETGEPIGPNVIYKRYIKFRRALLEAHPEMPALGYHELRHTYATILNELGVPDNLIALLMGHGENTKMTNSTYIHQNMDYIKKVLGTKKKSVVIPISKLGSKSV